MESAQRMLEKETKLMAALNWKSAEEQPEVGDPNYRAFVQVMTYRRKVAETYFKHDDEGKEEVWHIIEHCNKEIRQILGV